MPDSAFLDSWNVGVVPVLVIAAMAFVYLRGCVRARTGMGGPAAFLSGLLLVVVALESPLDTFGALFLWVHMAQHILLMLAAPLLIMLGRPWPILLRGMPAEFVREGLGPFFRWKPFHAAVRWFTSPVAAWLIYALTLILWHLPRLYQLALSSPGWHNFQHACFFWSGILFWSPILTRHPRAPRWFAIPYLLLADILNTAFSAFLVFSGRVLYPVYDLVRPGVMKASTDQAIAGLVMWVPGSLFFLLPAIAVAYRLLASDSRRRSVAPGPAPVRNPFAFDLRPLRRVSRPVMLIIALAIILEGFAGSRSAATLTWFYWRALVLFVLLAIGNLFCMACPLTLVRDAARKIISPRAQWPAWLRNKWIAVALFGLYLWAYGEWSLWSRPAATAWIITAYFTAILVVDCTFSGAAFCKYVCPIGQFNFLASANSPREIGVRERAVCSACRTHDCARGNQSSRGCELGLFQPAKAGNLDCTFCLDCVAACPSSNVALVRIARLSTLASEGPRSGIGSLSKRNDIAALAAMFTFGALLNASQMLDLSPIVRSVFIAGPILAVAICFAANALLVPAHVAASALRRCIFALTPVGLAVWAAHLLYHVAPASLSVASLRDLQLLALDAGVLISIAAISKATQRFAVAAPWHVLSLVLYSAGVWIAFQPMPMSGMSM